jgi:MFS-type transporter involved in bile tolerance (Atg22 family)
MNQQEMVFLVPITLFIAGFGMIFGIRYLVNKEKMAMIERGLNPNEGRSAPKPFLSLKFGLLLVGLGLGLLVALMTVTLLRITEEDAAAVYFGFIALFGGFGLICSYLIEKKWLDQENLKDKS